MFVYFFTFLGPVCWAITCLTLVRHLPFSKYVKWGISALLFLASLKATWFRIFGKSLLIPELSPSTLYFLSIIHDIVTMSAICGVFFMLITPLLRLSNTYKQNKQLKKILAVVFLVFGFFLGAKGVINGIVLPDEKTITLEFENLPPSFDGFKILHISDIHATFFAPAERTKNITDIANRYDADLIAITGDFIDGKVKDHYKNLEPLKNLKAKYGVVGCTGNHEYYSKYHKWRKAFYDFNIKMLENTGFSITKENESIFIAGINDPISGNSDAALALSNSSTNEFKILLAHRPSDAQFHAEKFGVDLQLSGHTHGGIMPLFDYLVKKANNGYVRGKYNIGKMTLYVNTGAGQCALIPLRLWFSSEITEIILKRKTNK